MPVAIGAAIAQDREARQARNPRTGESVQVPRRLTPYFTVGKELRDRLNPASGESLPDHGGATSGPADEGRCRAAS